jgi:hypothetical protein
MDGVVFTSETSLWRTERALARWMHWAYGPFTLDAAASDGLIAPVWLGPGGAAPDGLQAPWDGDVFCNPPYSEVGLFVAKAVYELQENPLCRSITLLVGARNDTAWWQDSWAGWSQVALLRGRVKFWLTPEELAVINEDRAHATPPKKPISDENTAPFPSAVLRWSRSLQATVHPSVGPLVQCVDWRALLRDIDHEAVA